MWAFQHLNYAAAKAHVDESNKQTSRYHCPACGLFVCSMTQLSDGEASGHLFSCKTFLRADHNLEGMDYDELTHLCAIPAQSNAHMAAHLESITVPRSVSPSETVSSGGKTSTSHEDQPAAAPQPQAPRSSHIHDYVPRLPSNLRYSTTFTAPPDMPPPAAHPPSGTAQSFFDPQISSMLRPKFQDSRASNNGPPQDQVVARGSTGLDGNVSHFHHPLTHAHTKKPATSMLALGSKPPDNLDRSSQQATGNTMQGQTSAVSVNALLNNDSAALLQDKSPHQNFGQVPFAKVATMAKNEKVTAESATVAAMTDGKAQEEPKKKKRKTWKKQEQVDGESSKSHHGDRAQAPQSKASLQGPESRDFGGGASSFASASEHDQAPTDAQGVPLLSFWQGIDNNIPEPEALLFPMTDDYLHAAEYANPKGITDLNNPDSLLVPLKEDRRKALSISRCCKGCEQSVRVDDASSHGEECLVARKFRYDINGYLVLVA